MLTPEQIEQLRVLLATLSELLSGLDSEPIEPEPTEDREYDPSGWSLNFTEPGARYSQKIDAMRAEVEAMPASVIRTHLLGHPLLNRAFVCYTPDHLNSQLSPDQNFDRMNNVSITSFRYGRSLSRFKGETDPITNEETRQERNIGKRGMLSDWRNFGARTFPVAADYIPGTHQPAGEFPDTIVLNQFWRCDTDEHIADAVRRFVDAVIENGPSVFVDPFSAYTS